MGATPMEPALPPSFSPSRPAWKEIPYRVHIMDIMRTLQCTPLIMLVFWT